MVKQVCAQRIVAATALTEYQIGPIASNSKNTSEANTVQTDIQPKDPKAREGQLQNQSLKI